MLRLGGECVESFLLGQIGAAKGRADRHGFLEAGHQLASDNGIWRRL